MSSEESPSKRQMADEESPSKKQKTGVTRGIVYTLQCTSGNPDKPLHSFVRNAKKDFIQDQLAQRGLDTTGSKAVLLHRLQTALPSLTFEFDGCRIFNAMLQAFLHYFKYDDMHMFSASMPRRGATPKRVKLNLPPNAGNMHMPSLYESDADAGGKRHIGGAADCYLLPNEPTYYFNDLNLQENDVINITYDGGPFIVKILKIEQDKELEEDAKNLGAKLLSRGEFKMRPQYGREIGSDEEEGDY